MASWAEFETVAPEFAARVRSLLTSRKHLTMATLRRDGSPRISGTELEFADGQLQIGSMPRAVKALDLRRDPRVAIHGATEDPPSGNPAAWKGEAKIAGTAMEVESGGPVHRFHRRPGGCHHPPQRSRQSPCCRILESARGVRTLERE